LSFTFIWNKTTQHCQTKVNPALCRGILDHLLGKWRRLWLEALHPLHFATHRPSTPKSAPTRRKHPFAEKKRKWGGRFHKRWCRAGVPLERISSRDILMAISCSLVTFAKSVVF
jgi:hypothetical protein